MTIACLRLAPPVGRFQNQLVEEEGTAAEIDGRLRIRFVCMGEVLEQVGFEPAAECWKSCYFHPEHGTYLGVYVDDFIMAGPEKGLEKSWKLISNTIDILDLDHLEIEIVEHIYRPVRRKKTFEFD